jgi:hypothetical protein
VFANPVYSSHQPGKNLILSGNLKVKVKVRVKIKVQFTLEQATKAHRGSRGIAVFFFNLGARWGY